MVSVHGLQIILVEGKTHMSRMLSAGIVSLCMLLPMRARAQFPNDRTLAGLKEVGVVVVNIHPDAEQRGLVRRELQRGVEKQLQAAGRRVARTPKENGVEKPLLYLAVGITPLEHFPVYTVNVSLQLRQPACLEHNLVICTPTVTWEETGRIRTVDVSELASVQRDVQSLVKHFPAAYQTENQR
jgi:hypothetical protein